MTFTYLKLAFRNLLKNKKYLIINILGSGIAIACCITAYLLLAFNLEFDDFHADEKVKNIYSFYTYKEKSDGKIALDIRAPYVLPEIASQELPGINRYSRYISTNGYVSFDGKAFDERVTFADSTFFEMFDFPLHHGDHGAFKQTESIFLTKEKAEKYFGDENPVGKILKFQFENDTHTQAIVAGVIDQFPTNNTFFFGMLMRIEQYDKIDRATLKDKTWGDWREPSLFIELVEGYDVANMDETLVKYKDLRNEFRKSVVVSSYALKPFKNYITWEDIDISYVGARIDPVGPIIFVVLAFMILLISSFNFTNTTISILSRRFKEVGIRKVLGARKRQILIQFFTETIVVMTLAVLMGLFMASYIVPVFAEMWDLPYGLHDMNIINLISTLLLLLIVSSILAGIYPGLYSIRFDSVKLIKGEAVVRGANILTRGLASLQFAISIMVLLAGIVFTQNTKYQETIDFGYEKESIITIQAQGKNNIDRYISKLRTNPKITHIAQCRQHIGSDNFSRGVDLDSTRLETRVVKANQGYLETIGLSLVIGNDFISNGEGSIHQDVIVNEAFVKAADIQDPIGKKFELLGSKRKIIGVVEDHLDNLYRSASAEPFSYVQVEPEKVRMIVVRTDRESVPKIEKYLENTWNDLFPTVPFKSRPQEDILLGGMRDINSNLVRIFLFLTVLGGLLSSCGIYALASLNIEKRSKEIGIRKSVGASTKQIVSLLNKEFVWIMVISAILGSTGGYLLVATLLDQIYKIRIEISIIPILASSVFIVVLGLMTTSYTIMKAAQTNPVLTLRDD